MRPTFLVLASLVALACNETGSVEYTPPGADADGGASGSGGTGGGTSSPGQTPTDPAAPPSSGGGTPAPQPSGLESFDACGEQILPAALPGSIRVGEAVLAIGDGFAATWEGCEVERFYDADGAFVCERSWSLQGEGEADFRETPQVIYAFEARGDEDATNCPDGVIDFEGRYGADLPRGFGRDSKVTLFRESRPDRWESVGQFPADISFSGAEISYAYPTGAP